MIFLQRYTFVFFILFLPAMVSAQPSDYTSIENAPARLKRAFEKSKTYIAQGDFRRAKHDLLQLTIQDSTFINAHIQLAYIFYDEGSYAAAERGLENALQLDPDYKAILYYQLGLAEIKQHKFDEASVHFQQYLDTEEGSERQRNQAQRYIEESEFSAIAMANPVPFDPIKLPESINSEGSEYLPCLTADGRRLVYTKVVDRQEDFYESYWEDGTWQEGKPLAGVNTMLNEGAQNISVDGRMLVFTACNRPDGQGSCDLYFSEWNGTQWSRPENMGPPINTGGWESQPSLSPNGKALFFSSNRSGGYGKKDLWVSYLSPSGNWSRPINLGESINTKDDEASPFIHPDNQTLYFMSNGHPGMGGTDLYFTRPDLENGVWAEPQNLGYPINTRGNEGSLIVSLDGRTAYFATDRENPAAVGESAFDNLNANRTTDIFAFELYEEARPAPVTYVRARVYDAVTLLPLVAKAVFVKLDNNQEWISSLTDSYGEFLVVLPGGVNYALNVSKEGYLFHSENFALEGIYELDEPYTLDIYLQPIGTDLPEELETNKPIILRNIFFEFDKDVLLPESLTELNMLKQLLVDYPDMKIQINGHTDSDGADDYNLDLSNRRAKAVYTFLVENEIEADRLKYKGFGETAPIDTNETAEGRQQNRRTEFVVIK